ncbi:MAG: HDIG domain-containing protein [Chloroflexota bacterium]|nr:HDIG domain-containing protein [Chloroflexota bacterium]
MPTKTLDHPVRHAIFITILLLLTSAAAFAAVVFIPLVSFSNGDLEVGDVAPQDILAPQAISYTSEVRTEQQINAARRSTIPRYTSVDTSIARGQLEQMRSAFAYVTSVRADHYAAEEQKLADLAALQNVLLNQETALSILEIEDAHWQIVQQESIVVLEQVMRNTIRENQIEETRRNVLNIVSLSLSKEQALIVADLVAAFIAPNSFYSETLTETAKQQAEESVEPIVITFAAGETVVGRGEVVSEMDIEALRNMGLAQPEQRWQKLVSAGVLVILSTGLAVIYLRRHYQRCKKIQGVLIITILFIAFLALARLALPAHSLVPYLYPLTAYALIISSLFGDELALVSVIPLIILITFGHANSSELILFYGISSLFGVLIPKRAQRISTYLWVGITIAASGAAMIAALRLAQPETNWINIATISAISLLNGLIAVGLTVLLQYLLAPIMGQITPLQLLEISRPDSPLLEYLLHNAPGTYQHSLQVANLAEQAAERIDANSFLTRVGALHHDIGKAQNPYFFIENQVPGQLDTHDNLNPAETAAIIIKHVTDGLELARQHHLPGRIRDFISEHHGTMMTRYQWTQAVNEAGGDESLVDEDLFRYPGPRPQSRETALVMLADSCEARVRAQKPETEQELRAIIKDNIDTRLGFGQLDDTSFKLLELQLVADSYTAGLRGIYHPRVDYPSLSIPTRPTGVDTKDQSDS